MTESANSMIVLAERPQGDITSSCFAQTSKPVPVPNAGQVVVRNLWLSFDPAQRGWINDVASYIPPVAIGEPMRAYGVGQVVESKSAKFAEGQLVAGVLNWQQFALLHDSDDELIAVPDDVPDPRLMLSLLGTTGLTAYFGITEVARVVAGDAVLVTAAAGATGSVAGQVARATGASIVVGTAGSDAKRDWAVNVAGFDACVDHYEPNVRRALQAEAPEGGFSVVYDNVGGKLLDRAIMNTAVHGRIALCGAISTGYRPERPSEGLFAYQLLTTRRIRMEGFLLFDFAHLFERARRQLTDWFAEGVIKIEHDQLDGLEKAPEGLRRLFGGGNLGKQILQVAEPL